MSDLRMNNVRGYLAEFLVAKAVGAVGQRVEWDAFDVLTPGGVKIEVKSSAYLQAWDQERLSRIAFTGLRGRTGASDGHPAEARYRADVYVLAVQTATRHEDYNPLDVGQWTFYVLPRTLIASLGYRSLSLTTLRQLTDGPTMYPELGRQIASVIRSTWGSSGVSRRAD